MGEDNHIVSKGTATIKKTESSLDCISGNIEEFREIKTIDGPTMIFLHLTEHPNVQIVVFPDQCAEYRDLIVADIELDFIGILNSYEATENGTRKFCLDVEKIRANSTETTPDTQKEQ